MISFRAVGMFAAAAILTAASPAAGQMVTAKNPQSVVKALQDSGYKAQLEKSEDGDPMIRSASSGSKFTVFFYNCTAGANCATVQFYTGYEKKGLTLEQINEWNRSQRFGRAYLDKDGEPVVEMDVDLDDGGVSPALFTDNLEFWTSIMSGFEKHIGW